MRLHSNGGGEYLRHAFQLELANKGIQFLYSTPESQQQNKASERLNRTIYNRAFTFINNCSLPENFWPEAVKHANFIRNILLVKSSETQTPYKIKQGEVFDYSWIRTFGCDVWYRAGSQKKFSSYVNQDQRTSSALKVNILFAFEINRQNGLCVPQLFTSKRLFQQFLVAISVKFKKSMLNTTLILQILTLGSREKKLHLIALPDTNSIDRRSSSLRELKNQSAHH